jgi:hypothetical protein
MRYSHRGYNPIPENTRFGVDGIITAQTIFGSDSNATETRDVARQYRLGCYNPILENTRFGEDRIITDERISRHPDFKPGPRLLSPCRPPFVALQGLLARLKIGVRATHSRVLHGNWIWRIP